MQDQNKKNILIVTGIGIAAVFFAAGYMLAVAKTGLAGKNCSDKLAAIEESFSDRQGGGDIVPLHTVTATIVKVLDDRVTISYQDVEESAYPWEAPKNTGTKEKDAYVIPETHIMDQTEEVLIPPGDEGEGMRMPKDQEIRITDLHEGSMVMISSLADIRTQESFTASEIIVIRP